MVTSHLPYIFVRQEGILEMRSLQIVEGRLLRPNFKVLFYSVLVRKQTQP